VLDKPQMVPFTLFPFYHLVSDHPPAHIRHLYISKTTRQFEEDLDFLSRKYQFVSLLDFKQMLSGELRPNRQTVHLTFDDGLSECYHIVAPILERFGISATFFLNSAFIGNADLFYRYKVSLLIDSMTTNKGLEENVRSHLNINDTRKLKSYLLNLGFSEISKIDTLAIDLKVDFNQYLTMAKPYMDKKMIVDLNNRGFTFGAHSHDHPYMNLIPENEQMDQVSKSIMLLTSNLGIPIDTFAFPFTDYGVRGSTIAKMHASGLVHLSFGSSGIRPDEITNHFQRFSLEEGGKSARFLILKERLKAIGRKVLGKNTLKANRWS